MNIRKNNVALNCDEKSSSATTFNMENSRMDSNLFRHSYAEIAEWLTHLIDTQSPLGHVARDPAQEIDNLMIVPTTKSLGVQVPTSSVTNFKFLKGGIY